MVLHKKEAFIPEDEIRIIDTLGPGEKIINDNVIEIVFGSKTSSDVKELVIRIIKEKNYPVKRIGNVIDNGVELIINYTKL